MRITSLSSLLVAAALATAPAHSAFAARPATAHHMSRGSAPAHPATAATSDADRYAAREAKDKDVAKFQGGGEVLVVGGSTLGVIVLVVLLVILL